MGSNNINSLLVERITRYLNPHLQKLRDYHIKNEPGKIEVIGSTGDNPLSQFVFVCVNIREEWKQLFISKIYRPDVLKHQGVGKQLIRVIHNAATELEYELFIAQMTDSFYARMRKRGALECEKPDMVQIVDTTKLD